MFTICTSKFKLRPHAGLAPDCSPLLQNESPLSIVMSAHGTGITKLAVMDIYPRMLRTVSRLAGVA